MIEIPLCIYIGFKINALAKRKDQNTTIWIILAIVSFFAAYIIGMAFLLTTFYKGGMQQEEILVFFQHPLRMIFVWFSGFGGYLFIKYLLERMQDKTTERSGGEE